LHPTLDPAPPEDQGPGLNPRRGPPATPPKKPHLAKIGEELARNPTSCVARRHRLAPDAEPKRVTDRQKFRRLPLTQRAKLYRDRCASATWPQLARKYRVAINTARAIYRELKSAGAS